MVTKKIYPESGNENFEMRVTNQILGQISHGQKSFKSYLGHGFKSKLLSQ